MWNTFDILVRQFALVGPDPITDRPFLIGVLWCAILLIFAGVAILVLRLCLSPPCPRLSDFARRYRTWAVLVPVGLTPMALGPGWMILSVSVLSLFAYRDLSRALGIGRDARTWSGVILGGSAIFTGALLNRPDLALGALPLTIALLIVLHLTAGPRGYLDRVSKGALAFFLTWYLLGQMALLANLDGFRNVAFLIVFLLGLNDIACYLGGRALGRHSLAPELSPNKTIEGALCGALVCGLVAATMGHLVLPSVQAPLLLVLPGVALGLLGQVGDLIVSAIKRDLGLKDLGSELPGLGGVLDRFDSMLLVAPVVCCVVYLHSLSH